MNRPQQRKRNTEVKKTKQGATHKGPMQIIVKKPPAHIWDACDEAFELSGTEIFCYGDKIYSPSSGYLTPELIAHEGVHRVQQGDDPDGWWEYYIENAEFRLEMELEAHKKEYRVFKLRHKRRDERAMYLEIVGERLASPMYGEMITKEEAMRGIAKR